MAGVDVGIVDFAVTSGGLHIENPRFGRKAANRLKHAQQRLARKQWRSMNRQAAKETVAKRHRKVAAARRDFHCKTARALVTASDVLFVEDPKIANMVRRARPVPDPEHPGQWVPNGQAAKSGLNRSIHDAGWGAFVDVLKAKAEEAGRRVLDIDPRHTSDHCEACGHTAKDNRVTRAVFLCQKCAHQANADEHAARNIYRAGLALLAAEHPDSA
jgi:putative transposase